MFDVIVIGGGTIGAATAYYLSKQQIGKVALFDKGTIGGGAASWAASLLTQVRAKTDTIPLVQETYRALEALEAELGESIGAKRVGSLQIAGSEKTAASIDNLAEIATQFGIANHWVDAQEVKAMVPWINEGKVLNASFMPDDVFLEAFVLANAYAKAARRNGAALFQDTEVTEIVAENGRVTGVRTQQGFYAAPFVVDAAGAWSNLLSMPQAIPLPMAPVRSIYWITRPNPALFPSNQPMTVIPDAMAYSRPETGGLLFGIRDRESPFVHPRELPETYNGRQFIESEKHWEILLDEGKEFREFFPGFEDVEIAHCITGVSTYTPDSRFVIGPSPRLEGFYAATGCVGAGVAMSAGFGRVVSELIAGQPPFTDISAFAPTRLGDFDPFSDGFMEQCSAARANKKDGG